MPKIRFHPNPVRILHWIGELVQMEWTTDFVPTCTKAALIRNSESLLPIFLRNHRQIRARWEGHLGYDVSVYLRAKGSKVHTVALFRVIRGIHGTKSSWQRRSS